VIGNKLLPPSIQENIIERSDGIPLFVEEMTKAVLEAGIEGAAEQIAAVPSPMLAVLASLHASLMARLDRLGSAKEVAQVGSAIGREFSYALLAAVARKPDVELQSALDRLIGAGLLFRQGVPPQASYLFKHALVQDAAYGTLLREPRRGHARIAVTLETQFTDIAENQPELLARHCTEAALIEKAAAFWAKAGYRSLARSALVEAAEQFRRALGEIATLPMTPMLRRERIKLQVALINPLMHIKGYAGPETKAAMEQARLLIEPAEALGEPPEDPLLLFSVLYGFWVANVVAFDGGAVRGLAAQFLALAEKQTVTAPIMIGNRLMGYSLMTTGDFAEAKTHLDKTFLLYDPSQHRSLATRVGQDLRAATVAYRALVLWALGYPRAARADVDYALEDARAIGQAATLMYTMVGTLITLIHRGDFGEATALSDELVKLAGEKSPFWKGYGEILQGCVAAVTSNPLAAIRCIASGMAALRPTGSTFWMPLSLSYLSNANAAIGKYHDAWRCACEGTTLIETARETWAEAEVTRNIGEILLNGERDAAKAEAYFERALAVARQQQAKSFELRASMSLARLWRDQGKAQQTRELLAPVYGWFTEGFDTRDLKEAKALLGQFGT
jgi:predicted ATPase